MSARSAERPEVAGDRIAQQISDYVSQALNGTVSDEQLAPVLGEYNGHPQWSVPCVRALLEGDTPENSHRNKGRAATYDGNHTARLSFYKGQLQLRCFSCCSAEREGLLPEQYTQEVVSALGIEAGNVQGIGPTPTVSRTHRYPVEHPAGTILKSKMSYPRGYTGAKNPWRYQFEDAQGDRTSLVTEQYTNGTTRRTPEEVLNSTLSAAAGLYNMAGVSARPHAVLVFCEGEKDADVAEQLIGIAGQRERFVAVTVPVMTIGSLSASVLDAVQGRTVITVFDPDVAGDEYQRRWAGLLWDHVERWQDTTLPQRDQDLSDWADSVEDDEEAAAAFIYMLEHSEPVTERPVPADHWRHVPVMKADGSANTTHPLNAQHALIYHPDTAGCLQINSLSKSIMTVDAPFAPGPVSWPNLKELGLHFMEFFSDENLNLALSAFSAELLSKVAKSVPEYSPNAEVLAVSWDGIGRAETLFSSYLPLDADAEQQRALSRLVLRDMVRALRGDPTAETSKFVALTVNPGLVGTDIVNRMLPDNSASKVTQRVQERDVLALLRKNITLVQYPLTCLSVFNNFIMSANVLNASGIETAPAEYTGPPAFLFVGSASEDLSGLPDNAYTEHLALERAQDGLHSVFPQMVAEAIARESEWKYLPPPVSNAEVAHTSVMTRLGTIGKAVAYYVFHQVDGAITGSGDCFLYSQVVQRPERVTPLEQVATSDLHRVMDMYFKTVYGSSRSETKINRELKSLWDYVHGPGAPPRHYCRSECRSECRSTAVPEHVRKVSGFKFNENEQYARLRSFLYEMDPDGGGTAISVPGTAVEHLDRTELSNDTNDLGMNGTLERLSRHTREEFFEEKTSLRARDTRYKREGLEGTAAKTAEILSTPGLVGLDFETHPGAWAYWKAKMIADGTWPASPEMRTKLQHQNEFNNAPPRRKPCILTVTHQNGRRELLRLTGTIEERRTVLRDVFSHLGDDTKLAAHNAQFESEVLYAAGVEVEIDCTMIASKLIYAEAYAWDEDDDDAPGFGDLYATEDEDIGLIDPHTGELDVSRVQPIGKLRRHSLKACIQREFGEARDKTLRDIDWDSEKSDDPEYRDYAQIDADDAMRLWTYYRDAMTQLGIWEGYRNLADAIPAVSEINVNGAILNEEKYLAFRTDLDLQVRACDAELHRIAPGIPIAKKNFNDKMRWWLLEQLWDGLLDVTGDTGPRFAQTRAEQDWEALEEGRKAPGTGTYWTSICNVVAAAGFELGMTRGTFDEETRHRTHGMGLDKGGRSKLLTFLTESGVAPTALRFMECYARRNIPATLFANTAEAFHSMRDPVTGRITGNHQIAGAVTGRQNCSKVNLQQVPTIGPAREMFEPAPGRKFIVADYSQVELRVGAIIAEDEVLIDVYRRGVDVHTATGARCYHVEEESVESWMRRKAKAVNFGSFYGAAGAAIAASLGAPLAEGEKLLQRFLEAYPGVAAYRERTSGESGPITILPGRRVMCLPDVHGPKRTNYPIQGAAASVQHLALALLFAEIRRRNWHNSVVICLAIHDEIVVECPEEMADEVAEMVNEQMALALLTIMPGCAVMGRDRLVDAGVCDHWGEKA